MLSRMHSSAEHISRLFISTFSPEHYLIAAVLVRAVLDLYSSDYKIVNNALKWFHCTDPIQLDRGFTYQQIIETLNFKPSQVLLINKKIKELKYGQRVCEGEEGGAEHSELAEGQRMRVCSEKRSTLWQALGRC